MTKVESLKVCHLIIRLGARIIIIIIISTIQKRLLSWLGWGRRSKTTKVRLEASDATNPGVHLTHLIKNMVKTTTKISTHKLKLIHEGSERDLSFRRIRGRSRWGRGSRGRNSICQSRLHTRLLCNQLCITPPNRFLANGTCGTQTQWYFLCRDLGFQFIC